MQLTLHTDYALRLLVYLATSDADSWVPVGSVAATFAISSTHLTKVTQTLVGLGYVESKAGRGGGVRLAKPPADINIGQVVRDAEPSLAPVPCLASEDDRGCVISPACGLKAPLAAARDAFLEVLDDYSLADCVARRPALRGLLQLVTQKGR